MSTFADVSNQTRCVGNVIRARKYDPNEDFRDNTDKCTWKKQGGDKPTESLLVVIEPDSTLDLKPTECKNHTYIQMFKKTEELVEILQKKSADELMDLMDLPKKKLAESHVERFKNFHRLQTKQACLLFGGKDLKANSYDDDDRKFAEKHLRLISGLYGVLRPFDDVRPVRDLPMGARLTTKKGKIVEDFWGDGIARQIAKDAQSINKSSTTKTLIVCALSEDYWRTVQVETMPEDVKVVKCCFENGPEEGARRGRQKLARFLLRENACSLHTIREFDDDDWAFDTLESDNDRLIFKWRAGTSDKKEKKNKKRKARSASDCGSSDNEKRKKAPQHSRRKGAEKSESPNCRGGSRSRSSPRRKPEVAPKNDEKGKKKDKNNERVRNSGYDSDDSGAYVIAPKKRNDDGIRESSRSPAKRKPTRHSGDSGSEDADRRSGRRRDREDRDRRDDRDRGRRR